MRWTFSIDFSGSDISNKWLPNQKAQKCLLITENNALGHAFTWINLYVLFLSSVTVCSVGQWTLDETSLSYFKGGKKSQREGRSDTSMTS